MTSSPEPKTLPRYPIYIPSKGRYQPERAMTARCLMEDGVPFHLVCEKEEREQYAELVGEERLIVLPFSQQGLYRTRCWIMEHSIETTGAARHWQLDDNMRKFWRVYKGRRIPCSAGVALRVCEDLSDRYTNVGVSGLAYYMFGPHVHAPFCRNVHVYSCTLVNNSIPYRWRLAYNDDTDLCLQVLAGGLCTILLYAFLVEKRRTMTVKGGNTDDATGPINYQGDGRLKMARALEREWPYVVRTERRFGRPQHVIRGTWAGFDTPLQLRDDIDLSELKPDEYGMKLKERKPVRNDRLRELLESAEA